MWRRTLTYSLASPPDDVWAVYTDAAIWSTWSSDIAWAQIDGPYRAGASGRMRFRGLPAGSWVVLAADQPRTFASEFRLPLLRVHFDHRLVARGTDTQVTEAVSFRLPLGWLLGPVLARRWARRWPGAMGAMGELAYLRAERRLRGEQVA